MPGIPQHRDTYGIEVEEEAWEGLSSLSPSAQERVTALWRDHLQYTPAETIPGKLKRLRGRYSGYFQFRISRSHRMIYAVDEKRKKVYIEYIGTHPNWRRRHRSRAF